MHDSMHAIAKFVELMNSYEDTRLADWMDAHGAVENARKRVEQTKYTLKRHQHELFRDGRARGGGNDAVVTDEEFVLLSNNASTG